MPRLWRSAATRLCAGRCGQALLIKRTRKIGIIVAVFYLAGTVAALHAALTARTAPGAIAWSVSLVSMPFVALPAYLVFGRNKFEGMAQAFESRQDEFERGFSDIQKQLESWTLPASSTPSWGRALESLSRFDLLNGNAVELLVDGNATFESILEGMRQAENYILFQFYMIHDDDLGRRVKSTLIEKATAGVTVVVLYDEVGSSGLPRSYVSDLAAAGAQVSSFRPNQGWTNRFQLNFRNHRKMVVVDGKSAWVGGHNVGDEYLGEDPDFSPWRDTHVRIDGPAALQVQLTILSDWYWATRELPSVSWTPQPAADSNQVVTVLPTAPTGNLETASLFFVTALSAARERIWIASPYFVPDEAMAKALQLAALRGVDVRVLTTGKPDSWPVYLAAFHYMHELSEVGIEFYAYEPGFMHQKVMLIDDGVAAIGTHNFDNRSSRLNFEVTAVIADSTFAADVKAMLEADFENARRIADGDWQEEPIWWRLAVRVARLASPVL